MRKFGLAMQLPKNKKPGFYAQIVKALAGAIDVFDRDKELIIVSTREEEREAAQVMGKYGIVWDSVSLWLLPEDAVRDARCEDYGFTSRSGNAYLYEDTVAAFRIPTAQPDGADVFPALLQMEEFILASFEQGGQKTCFVEAHLRDTIAGIARRYGTAVRFDFD